MVALPFVEGLTAIHSATQGVPERQPQLSGHYRHHLLFSKSMPPTVPTVGVSSERVLEAGEMATEKKRQENKQKIINAAQSAVRSLCPTRLEAASSCQGCSKKIKPRSTCACGMRDYKDIAQQSCMSLNKLKRAGGGNTAQAKRQEQALTGALTEVLGRFLKRHAVHATTQHLGNVGTDVDSLLLGALQRLLERTHKNPHPSIILQRSGSSLDCQRDGRICLAAGKHFGLLLTGFGNHLVVTC